MNSLGMFLAFVLCAFSFRPTESAGGNETVEWGYFDAAVGVLKPAEWHTKFPTCGLTRQSPIHIDTSRTVYDRNLGTFTFTSYDRRITTNMTNNGHSVVFSVSGDEDVKVSGGGLVGTYKLVQFHLHWGAGNENGSEHRADGRQYGAELHLVHYNTKYDNISQAVGHRDGLAVLGIMLEIRDGDDNPNYSSITDHITNVAYPDRPPFVINGFHFDTLLPENNDDFYRYEGSLTTPGCNEVVMWTVFTTPSYLSQRQIAAFRTELHHATEAQVAQNPSLDYILVDNHRPTQHIGSRRVTRSKFVPVLSSATLTAPCYGSLTLTLLLLYVFSLRV